MRPWVGYVLIALVVPAIAAVTLAAWTYHPKPARHPRIARHSCLADPSAATLAFDATGGSRVVYEFIYDAVFRTNPARAYELATPEAQGGWGRKQWATGDIPVVPQPVSLACTVGAHRHKRDLAWDVILRINGTYYLATVVWKPPGSWLVDYFQPLPTTFAPRG